MPHVRVISLDGAIVHPDELPDHPETAGALVIRTPELRIFTFRGRQGDEVLFEEVPHKPIELRTAAWSPPAFVSGHKCRCRTDELCHRHLTAALWFRITTEISAVSIACPEIGQSELVGRVMGRLATSGVRAPDQHVLMAVIGLRSANGAADRVGAVV